MQEHLIVDGYNIIYAWPEFCDDKDTDIQHARYRLISILADYSSFCGQKVLVVFDAYKQKNLSGRVEKIDGVEVIYTKSGETADALIERLTGELLAKGEVYVATSDWAEQVIVFGRGAYRLTPGELRARIKVVKEEIKDLWPEDRPLERCLENRLNDETMRSKLEDWRREKG